MIAADKLGGGAVGSLRLAGSACADVLSSPWASVNERAARGARRARVRGGGAARGAAARRAGGGAGGGQRRRRRRRRRGARGGVRRDGGLLGGADARARARIQQPCTLCIGSAVLSGALAAVALRRPRLGDGRTDSAVYGGGGALVGLVAAGCLYFLQSSQLDARAPPPIFAHSSPRAPMPRAITAKGSQHVRRDNLFYCIDQMETLGREAMAAPARRRARRLGQHHAPTVECVADGASWYAMQGRGSAGTRRGRWAASSSPARRRWPSSPRSPPAEGSFGRRAARYAEWVIAPRAFFMAVATPPHERRRCRLGRTHPSGRERVSSS